MSSQVVVIDYGVGNILSVTRALEAAGASVITTCDPHLLLNADKLILPGVGAFADGMSELNKRGLIEPIRDFALTGKPLLGICLGMQLLFSESDEFGLHKGLNLLAGRVTAIPNEISDGGWRKTPHIGWNELKVSYGRDGWDNTLLNGLVDSAAVYFVHSFAVSPEDSNIRLADCNYEGFIISAAIQKNRIFGCQFHPEKSGEIGLSIIKNFLAI
jgi:glutamine amidotransferase